MTTATANTEGQTPPTDGQDDLEGRTPTDHILTGQEGDEAVDDAEVEAAMTAGWKRAGSDTTPAGRVRHKDDAEGEEDITDVVLKNTTTTGDGDDAAGGEGATAPNAGQNPPAEDDHDIPGLGKASEVKARLARMEALEKAVATTSGHLGHLKQLVSQAGKGKPVTKEMLKNVASEFGDEFADAMARDLSEAGFGSGAVLDVSAVEQMVQEQVSAAREAVAKEFEQKQVLRNHRDAQDYFAPPKLDAQGRQVFQKDAQGNEVPVWNPGPKHAAFMQFIGTLPKDRQDELATSWDSDVISRALTEFKEHEKKAANKQATQTARIERAVAPKVGNGAALQQPAEDPVMQGWKNVRGRGPASAGARR